MRRLLAATLVGALSFGLSTSLKADCGSDHANTKNRTSIVESAVAAGQFSTLVAAVKAAGLVETLEGPGPFTVFAPNDAAFKKLPPETLEALLKNPDQLRQILTYHVVPGRIEAAQVLGGAPLVTLQGQSLLAALNNGQPTVQGARILSTDISCSNGVIHVIDTVVLPR